MNHYNPKKELRALRQVRAHKAFLASLRLKLGRYMEAYPARAPYSSFEKVTPRANLTNWPRYRISFAAVGAIIIIIAGSGSTIALAKNSLPGDILYPVKLFTEQIQLKTVSSPENRVLKNIEFAQRRVEEIAALTEQNQKDAGASIQTSVQEALWNLDSHLQQIADTAQTFKQSGENQKSQETETKLQQAANSYAAQLQTIESNQHETIRSEVEKSVQELKKVGNDTPEPEQNKNKNQIKIQAEPKDRESTKEQPETEKDTKTRAPESENSFLKQEAPEQTGVPEHTQSEKNSNSNIQNKKNNERNEERGEQDEN